MWFLYHKGLLAHRETFKKTVLLYFIRWTIIQLINWFPVITHSYCFQVLSFFFSNATMMYTSLRNMRQHLFPPNQKIMLFNIINFFLSLEKLLNFMENFLYNYISFFKGNALWSFRFRKPLNKDKSLFIFFRESSMWQLKTNVIKNHRKQCLWH